MSLDEERRARERRAAQTPGDALEGKGAGRAACRTEGHPVSLERPGGPVNLPYGEGRWLLRRGADLLDLDLPEERQDEALAHLNAEAAIRGDGWHASPIRLEGFGLMRPRGIALSGPCPRCGEPVRLPFEDLVFAEGLVEPIGPWEKPTPGPMDGSAWRDARRRTLDEGFGSFEWDEREGAAPEPRILRRDEPSPRLAHIRSWRIGLIRRRVRYACGRRYDFVEVEHAQGPLPPCPECSRIPRPEWRSIPIGAGGVFALLQELEALPPHQRDPYASRPKAEHVTGLARRSRTRRTRERHR